MADFKEQTNSLMVRVIPIYLAAELLCPNPYCERGRINANLGEGLRAVGAGRICHVKRCEDLLQGLFDGRPVEQQECGGGL